MTVEFLAEWALRSSILILAGALLLKLFRIKDPSIRLAAWTSLLCASLAIPFLSTALPHLPFNVSRIDQAHGYVRQTPSAVESASDVPSAPSFQQPFNWARAALIVYSLGALALFLRLVVGLALSLRLLARARPTGQTIDGIEIRESDVLAVPVTLGIIHPSIVLPSGSDQWDPAKLDAVLAHERSHIERHDPAVQFLSAIHRALLWYSPLSWFLHNRIVQVAEEASDDAAIAAANDRAQYAEVLLSFIGRGVRGSNWIAVPMARYGRANKRIHRILDGTSLSRGITRWSFAAILALASPLAYFTAAANPQVPVIPAPRVQPRETVSAPQPSGNYLAGLGSVSPYKVAIKPRVDGQLLSINFKEGEVVQAGQLLATIDPRPYQIQIAQAEGQLAQDDAGLQGMHRHQVNQAALDHAKLQLSYTQITSPITGVAGLRQVDPGNVVFSTSDAPAIVVITQLEPIYVIFTIPEDHPPLTMGLTVEAWNRDQSIKLATGKLTASDNQIDPETGTLKLKATFDNKDRALFPNQFVNIHLHLR